MASKKFHFFGKKTYPLQDTIGVYAQGKRDRDDAETFDMNHQDLNKSSILE